MCHHTFTQIRCDSKHFSNYVLIFTSLISKVAYLTCTSIILPQPGLVVETSSGAQLFIEYEGGRVRFFWWRLPQKKKDQQQQRIQTLYKLHVEHARATLHTASHEEFHNLLLRSQWGNLRWGEKKTEIHTFVFSFSANAYLSFTFLSYRYARILINVQKLVYKCSQLFGRECISRLMARNNSSSLFWREDLEFFLSTQFSLEKFSYISTFLFNFHLLFERAARVNLFLRVIYTSCGC